MPQIYRTSRGRMIVRIAAAVAIATAAISLWALWPPAARPQWLPAIALIWALGAPIWFFLEYVYVFDNWGDERAIVRFKDLQAHAAKIWAGVLALLTPHTSWPSQPRMRNLAPPL